MNKNKLFKILNWESKHFAYKVAEINVKRLTSEKLKDLLSELKKQNVKLAYWSVSPKDKISNNAAYQNHGFLADEKVTFFYNIPKKAENIIVDKNIHSYLYKTLNNQLLSLALQSGVYSRFEVDPNFINKEFEKLYTEWIRKSLNGNLAMDILVYTKNRKEIGLITITKKGTHGNIGLIAVDKKYRGKHIGKKLIDASFKRMIQLEFNKTNVVTQKKNKAALKFYEKLGFVVESIQNIYHFWLNE